MEHDCRVMEDAAMERLSHCLNRALGLAPAATQVFLRKGVLVARLTQALTPMTRMIISREAGAQIVQGAYDALLADCREPLARLAAQVAGRAVHQIRIAVDAPAETVVIEFLLQSEGGANA